MDQKSNQQLFNKAVSEGDFDTTITLIKSGAIDVNLPDVTHDLQTPLMRLCHSELSRSEAFKDILEIVETKAADLNQQDAIGRTLAMHACIAHNTDVLNFVIGHGCDVMVPDRQGKNLMHYAACSGNEQVLDVLLTHHSAGKALQTLDFQGYSPLDLAKQKKYPGIARKLTAFLQDLKQHSTTTHSSKEASDNRFHPVHQLINDKRAHSGTHIDSPSENSGKLSPAKGKPLSPLSNQGYRQQTLATSEPIKIADGGVPTFSQQHRGQRTIRGLQESQNHPTTGPKTLQPLNDQSRDVGCRAEEQKHGKGEMDSGTPVGETNDQNNENYPIIRQKTRANDSLPPCLSPNGKSPVKRRPAWCQEDVLINHHRKSATAKDRKHDDDNDDGVPSRAFSGEGNRTAIKGTVDNFSPVQQSKNRPRISIDKRQNGPKQMMPLKGSWADFRPDVSKTPPNADSQTSSSLELTSFLSPRPHPRRLHKNGLLQKRHDRDNGESMENLVSSGGKGQKSQSPDATVENISLKVQKQRRVQERSDSEQRDNSDPPGDTSDTGDKSRLRRRRPSISLPDLRDMTGCLVTSQEVSLLHQIVYDKSNNYRSSRRKNATSNKVNNNGNDNGEEDDDYDDEKDNAEIDGDSDSSVDSCFDDETDTPVSNSGPGSARSPDKILPMISRQSTDKH